VKVEYLKHSVAECVWRPCCGKWK